MADEFTVEDAHALARDAHAGQTDQQGRDYYEAHLLPVAATVEHLGEHAVMAALLHDLVEDTEHTLDDLRERGVPEPVVAAVDSVTRRPGESYPALIVRSCNDPLGVHIKLADNAHNIASNPGLAQTDPEKATSLLVKRYLPARDRLVEARTRHLLGLFSPPSPPAQPSDPDADQVS